MDSFTTVNAAFKMRARSIKIVKEISQNYDLFASVHKTSNLVTDRQTDRVGQDLLKKACLVAFLVKKANSFLSAILPFSLK